MYHSVTFGNKNTWDNWHIVPSSRPVFNPPKQKVNTLDIQGGNGIIDLSESLTGYPVYNNREGSFEFIVMNDYKPWQETYSDIADYLHGQKMRAVLEDDPQYYYEGRFSVNSWKSDKDWSKITIDYNVSPYKMRKVDSKEVVTLEDGTVTRTYTSKFYGKAPVCPTFDVQLDSGTAFAVRFQNTDLHLSVSKEFRNGTIQFPEMIFYGSEVKIYFLVPQSVSGTVTITCPYGRL